MTIREVMKILKQDGWKEIDTNGSHVQLKHSTKPGKVTVPKYAGDLPKGTLNSILKQAGLK